MPASKDFDSAFALQDVTCTFDGVRALDDVSVAFPRGHTSVLIGSSGSGKSTLLRLLIGLEWPASGTVLCDGESLRREALPEVRRRVGYVPEVPNLYDTLLGLFWELKKDKTAKPLYEHKVLRDYQLWVMPHPRTTMQNDPVMQILRQVQCQGAAGGTGTAGRTKIRVSMHAWNGERGTYIARRLRNLYAQGCDVRVLWALGGTGMKNAIGAQTPRGTVPRHSDGYNTDCDELQQVDGGLWPQLPIAMALAFAGGMVIGASFRLGFEVGEKYVDMERGSRR